MRHSFLTISFLDFIMVHYHGILEVLVNEMDHNKEQKEKTEREKMISSV